MKPAQNDGELIAAESCQCVRRTDSRLQARRDLAQQQVSRCMSQAVIDQLEAIQIDIEKCDDATGAPGARQRVDEPVSEQPAIGQSCQLVIKGLMLQLRFRALLLYVPLFKLRQHGVEPSPKLRNVIASANRYSGREVVLRCHVVHGSRQSRHRLRDPALQKGARNSAHGDGHQQQATGKQQQAISPPLQVAQVGTQKDGPHRFVMAQHRTDDAGVITLAVRKLRKGRRAQSRARFAQVIREEAPGEIVETTGDDRWLGPQRAQYLTGGG